MTKVLLATVILSLGCAESTVVTIVKEYCGEMPEAPGYYVTWVTYPGESQIVAIDPITYDKMLEWRNNVQAWGKCVQNI